MATHSSVVANTVTCVYGKSKENHNTLPELADKPLNHSYVDSILGCDPISWLHTIAMIDIILSSLVIRLLATSSNHSFQSLQLLLLFTISPAITTASGSSAAIALASHIRDNGKLEILSGRVLIEVNVVKNLAPKWPIIETDEAYYILISKEDPWEAFREATNLAVKALAYGNSLEWEDAYMLASMIVDIQVSQLVNPLKTVRARIPKEYISLRKLLEAIRAEDL